MNPLTKAELKWSEYKKVPVIVLDGSEQVNDSSLIISRLAAELLAVQPADKSSKKASLSSLFSGGGKKSADKAAAAVGSEEEEKWRRWVDERFVRVITVNIYRTAKESFQTFDYISENGNFGWVQKEAARVFGAGMMWALSNRLKKKYNVEGEVRDALYKDANKWVEEAVSEKKFLGGDAPNLADLAVFGVVKSVTGTDTFMDVQHKSKIGPWYERMMGVVGESSRLD